MDLLTKLQAESEVRHLLAAYAHAVDRRQLDECEVLFADDAVLEIMGETYQGRREIRRWLESLDSFGPAGKHVVCNQVITVGPDDGISAVSDFLVLKDIDGRWSSLVRGAYHDAFAYRDQRLKFRQRQIETIFAKSEPKPA